MNIRRRCALDAPAASPRRRRSGKHINRKLSWRPTPEVRAILEAYASSRARAGGRHRCPLTRAIEELIERGRDREEGAERLSRIQTERIEEKLEIVSAQASTLDGDTQTLACLLDAAAPQALAPSRIMAAWMADDHSEWQNSERKADAEDRILGDIEQVSQVVWKTWIGEIASAETPAALTGGAAPVADGEAVVGSYLMRPRPRQADCEDVHWKIDPAVQRRLKGVAAVRKTSASRLATALIELGLDLLDGRSTVPLHRAAMLEAQVGRLLEGLRANAERLRLVRQRVDLLGSRSCGLFDVLLHWHAQHVADVDGGGDDEAEVEAVENELRARFLSESELAWGAVVQSIVASEDDVRPEDARLDAAINEDEVAARRERGADEEGAFDEEFL